MLYVCFVLVYCFLPLTMQIVCQNKQWGTRFGRPIDIIPLCHLLKHIYKGGNALEGGLALAFYLYLEFYLCLAHTVYIGYAVQSG